MIEVDSLTFRFGRERTPVFEDFSWRVGPGEAWSVTGPSGAGKSTLLFLIVGLWRPESGRVWVDGVEASARANRGRVGLVLQDYGLLPWATARDNASLGLRVRRFYHGGAADVEAEPRRWLQRLGVEHLTGRYPGQLSGGERQRVAIARALALAPRVLLLDEPFSALDAPTRESLEQLTLGLVGEAGDATAATSSLVLVTHSIEEAVVVGQRILVLGTPPNRTATVIDNPLDGSARQSHAEFGRVCQEVRAALAAGARP